ncbi:MAG: hypothetical protein KDB29_15345 [Planctomycetes bacterium]|nr:hypothetical protein [Planctomycetota bacterium]
MERISATAHARARMQQRGISELQLLLIKHFGVNRYQKGGNDLNFIPRKTLKQLRHAIDKLDGKAAVFGEAEATVTVMEKTRRIHTTDYAA